MIAPTKLTPEEKGAFVKSAFLLLNTLDNGEIPEEFQSCLNIVKQFTEGSVSRMLSQFFTEEMLIEARHAAGNVRYIDLSCNQILLAIFGYLLPQKLTEGIDIVIEEN